MSLNEEWFTRPVSTNWSQFSGLAFALPIEANFARNYHREWLYNNWSVVLYISVVYVISIMIGQSLMANRTRGYGLRYLMSFWNSCLAIFSILGTIRCLPEFIGVVINSGLESSYCNNSYYNDVRLTFWYWLFVWSKVAELGDTAFIILRKQKLISLHWIHHVLTLSYAFYVIGEAPGTARWMVNMNFAVHSIMYSYYTLKSLQFKISRSIAMTITIGQICQMIFGLYINFNAYYTKYSGNQCDTSLSASASGLTIYLLFFVLFMQFFIRSYGTRVSLKFFKRLLRGAAKDVINKVD